MQSGARSNGIPKLLVVSASHMDDFRDTGRLIVFEGPDGVGKSTLCLQVVDRLRSDGRRCQYVTFPGREAGTIGSLVYELHHNPSRFFVEGITATSLQALHIAAHLDVIERRIRPALSEGTWVLLDRFWWSTWVYGRASGVSSKTLEAMIEVERCQWRGRNPDVVFLVDRVESPHEGDETRSRLRAAYRDVLAREADNYPAQLVRNDGSLDECLTWLVARIRGLFPDDGP